MQQRLRQLPLYTLAATVSRLFWRTLQLGILLPDGRD
jgi:hypothetical protein